MQTNLAGFIKDTPQGREAEEILRTCVHCGFCLATCPTYQLLGDELDSPRGRIYLMKQMLEGQPVTQKTLMHLDRCLTCRSCESTCPSGVKYGRLVDIGRGLAEQLVARPATERIKRRALNHALPRPELFEPALKLGQSLRSLLPPTIQAKLPAAGKAAAWSTDKHARRMLVLDGCVQPGLAPNINAAASRVLDRLGISLARADKAGCCGAVSYHLNYQDEGLEYVRRNVEAWWPHVEQGIEAIVITASGCGVMVKEYGHLLRNDPRYAARAEKISSLARDMSEILALESERIKALFNVSRHPGLPMRRIAFHSPCTLQHGQKIRGAVEALLASIGGQLTAVPDGHLCCGSAGTYSLLQGEISRSLLENKVKALQTGAPELILTANIGCLMHLQTGTSVPVRHWVEFVDEALSA